MRVKKIKIETNKSKSNKNKKNEFEMVKEVQLRKNRLDTVITVDSKGIITAISGENSANKKIGDSIYE